MSWRTAASCSKARPPSCATTPTSRSSISASTRAGRATPTTTPTTTTATGAGCHSGGGAPPPWRDLLMIMRTARILRAHDHERAGGPRSGRYDAPLEWRAPSHERYFAEVRALSVSLSLLVLAAALPAAAPTPP